MSIVTLVLVLLLLGFLAWAVGFLPFIEGQFKSLVRGVLVFIAVAVLVLWVLSVFGVGGGPHLHLR